MSAPVAAVASRLRETGAAWHQFWFTPSAPHTLALIRILAGAMILYTNLVWAKDLMAFLGPNAWVDNGLAREFQAGTFTWSFLWYIESPVLLGLVHFVAVVAAALLMLGWKSRWMALITWVFLVAYSHRLNGALFGLDQVNAMLAMYLMLGRCGDAYSLDHWLRAGDGKRSSPGPRISTNVAIRLIQLHLCVIYLFGGIGKMRGDLWWDGFATWFAIANYEYQSLDVTWLVRFPHLVALLTHLTVFWETFYCALVWPRFSRPWVLAMAVAVHGGIALFLGMITFGLAMLIANLAFVSPVTVDRLLRWVQQGIGRRLARRSAES